MKMISILEWNIHQQGRQSDIIPMCILDYIIDEDIIVLLEINSKSLNIDEFCEKLIEKGYNIYITDYKGCSYANDVLIAINSKNYIYVKRMSYYMAYNNGKIDDTTIPENLFLDVKINNSSYVIAAIRIKELNGNYEKRKKQMETFIGWTDKIDVPIILVGDFNNLIENTKEKEWNIRVLDNIINGRFIRKTPDNNHSWGVSYSPHKNRYDGYIKEDHLLISTSMKINETVTVNYSWDYLKNNINRCKVENINSYGQQKIHIPIGFPDHAILIAQIYI